MDEPPYERIFCTGRRRLRDASSLNAYGTGRRPLRDKPPYEAEAEAYGRRLRDEPSYRTESADYGRRLRDELLRDDPPYGTEAEALAGLASLDAYGTSLQRRRLTGHGTSLLTGRLLTGRRRLRHLTGRASLRGGTRGRTLLTKRRRFFTGRLRDASLRAEALTGRALIRAGDAYGTSLLTGRRRRLTGRASLRDGGAGTSLLTGRSAVTGLIVIGAEAQ